MKKVIFALLLIIVTFSFLACVPENAPATAQLNLSEKTGEYKLIVETPNNATTSKNTVVAQAEGEFKIMPDIAYITAGVTSNGKKQADVDKENRKKIDSLMNALEENGIQEKDIRTISYNVFPIRDYESTTNKIVGYEVQNYIEITLKDISKVGDILDVCAQAGANDTGSVRFDVSDKESAKNEALKVAVENAKAKAELMASAAGVGIGDILNITQEYSSSNEYNRYYAEQPAAPAMKDESTPATSISAGDITFRANAVITFEIQK